MAVKFYAVKKGRATGIFHTWEECKAQTAGRFACECGSASYCSMRTDDDDS